SIAHLALAGESLDTTAKLVRSLLSEPMSRFNMITQQELISVLSYDEESGVFTWRATGNAAGSSRKTPRDTTSYLRIMINRNEYRAHRLAFLYMTGRMPVDMVDHIDGNGLNNAWSNLRESNQLDNQHNRKTNRNNNTGVSGVGWCSSSEKWRARISDNGKRLNLGRFDSFDDAVKARKEAEAHLGYTVR
ncbi:HNH nuclease, partial [Vibrio phage 1.228.O._10N.261.49.C1]